MDSSSGEICCHQYLRVPILEILQGACALVLFEISVQDGCANALFGKFGGYVCSSAFCSYENEDARPLFGFE